MPAKTANGIAKKAWLRAEADFATWLMMAKLGAFDDLAPPARRFLTDYLDRIRKSEEATATAETIQDIYVAYFHELGGTGTPPPISTLKASLSNVVSIKAARQARSPAALPVLAPRLKQRRLPVWWIFGGMVAVIAAVQYALQGW